MKLKYLLCLLCLSSVAVHGNADANSYQGIHDARSLANYEASNGDVQIIRTDNYQNDINALAKKSYEVIGQSSFNAANDGSTDTQLLEHARKIGAHIVLVTSVYTHSVPSTMLLAAPNASPTDSTANATALEAGGVVNAYGSGTSTPFQRANFSATYLVKRRFLLGLKVENLEDGTREKLQSGGGVKVIVVMDDSPAFAAGIMVDDIVLAVNDETVTTAESFASMIGKYRGQSPTIKVHRDGKPIETVVNLN